MVTQGDCSSATFSKAFMVTQGCDCYIIHGLQHVFVRGNIYCDDPQGSNCLRHVGFSVFVGLLSVRSIINGVPAWIFCCVHGWYNGDPGL